MEPLSRRPGRRHIGPDHLVEAVQVDLDFVRRGDIRLAFILARRSGAVGREEIMQSTQIQVALTKISRRHGQKARA